MNLIKELEDVLKQPTFMGEGDKCGVNLAVNAILDKIDQLGFDIVEKKIEVPIEDVKPKADWLVWSGWSGNHDKRIDDAECSKCGFIHPIVFESLENLYAICPTCGSRMSVKEE